jgi:hypothetical protein
MSDIENVATDDTKNMYMYIYTNSRIKFSFLGGELAKGFS